MALVLAGISARNVYLSHATLTPVHSEEECAQILSASLPALRAVRALESKPRYRDCLAMTSALLGVPEQDVPVEVLVPSAAARRRRPGPHCPVWSGPLFPGAICRVRTGPGEEPIHVVSPALHFLLRCRELDATQALLLAFQLCGTYELRADLDCGFGTRTPQAHGDALRQAVHSLAPGAPGTDVARSAADRVIDGSASPRESGFATFAVTPRRSGGAGLPSPLLNHRVELTPRARVHLPENQAIRYDFYWPEKRLACEYDSSWWHDDPRRRGSDDRRRLAARALGDDLVGMARETLSIPSMTDVLVDDLALVLRGRRPDPLSPSSARRRGSLHGTCFGRHRWW